MGYYVDLSQIDLDAYRRILVSADLLPSRMVLKEDITKSFTLLKDQNIQTVEELLKALSSKKKIQQLATQTGVSENYLAILGREVRSYRQKPNKFRDFPGLSVELVQQLEEAGLKHTLQFFEEIKTPEQRADLANRLNLPEKEIERLARLTDLSRIRWVNHTFAYVLHEAGFDTAGKVAAADPRQLYDTVKQLNAERKIYKGQIGLHDMKLCVEAAQDVTLEIVFQ